MPRGLHIDFRVTADEYFKIEHDAREAGLSIGSYARAKLLTAPVTSVTRRPTVVRGLLQRLLGAVGKVGGNINQIARKLNTLGQMNSHDRSQLALALEHIKNIQAMVIDELWRG